MANLQVQVNFLENGRGGFYLLHAGFKYSVRTRRNNRTYWRCVDRQCPATVVTLDNILVSFGRPHNHEGDFIALAADSFVSKVKKRCRDEAAPIPSLYDEELGALRNADCDDSVEEMIRQIPTFQSCKSILYRSRGKMMPKLPTTPEEINLQDHWTQTLAHERFLLCDDRDEAGNRILLFATDANLQRLCASSTVYRDGTFYSCTSLFTQLYTLHADVEGTVFPLVFALLPNKTEATYRRLFSLLRTAVNERQSALTPETWMIDFEVAARNAVGGIFPNTTIRGCFFHYTQCIWRKVQNCGLTTEFRENEEFHRLVRRAGVLPLVPGHRVEDVWFQALEDSDDQTAPVMRFKDYVTETWVEGHLEMWNHFDHDGPRTTNAVEGWHNKFNRMCRRAHPNIFVFLELLQKEQAANEAKIIQITAGGVVRPKKRKYRQLDSRLQSLKNRLRQGEMDLMAYADAASHLVHFE